MVNYFALPLLAAIASASTMQLTGVNIAGAEFGEGTIPGTVGSNYIWPTSSEFAYWAGKGANAIRLPFQWGRLQLSANASFDSAQQLYLQWAVANCTERGMAAIIEPHNYARYPYSTSSNPIGSSGGATIANFANFWGRLGALFMDNNLVVYEIMNEPHTMSSTTWYQAEQAAINAIRATGAKNLILASGNCWTPVWRFTDDTSCDSDTKMTDSAGWVNLTDPLNNMMVDVHQYLDSGYSGTSETCVANASVFTLFTQWARTAGVKAVLTEIGTGTSTTCQTYFESVMSLMESNQDVWYGFTWWAAGSWWGSTFYSVEPSGSTDATQTAWLVNHFHNKTVVPGVSNSSSSTTTASNCTISKPSGASGWGTCSASVLSGTSCSFTCSSGYTASSGTCSDGSWTSTPQCTATAKANCTISKPSGASGWGTCSASVLSGSSCSFTCSSGYTASNGTCSDGSWTSTPKCTATTAGNANCTLSKPITAEGWGTCSAVVASGKSCEFSCYATFNANNGTCTDGSWDTTPTCTSSFLSGAVTGAVSLWMSVACVVAMMEF